MTDAQFESLLGALREVIASQRHYTLTGADDWPVMAFMAVAIVGLLVYVWQDLKNLIRDNRIEWKDALSKEEAERKEQDELLWKTMRECREECLPPRVGR